MLSVCESLVGDGSGHQAVIEPCGVDHRCYGIRIFLDAVMDLWLGNSR